MQQIPVTSQADPKTGIWFVFDVPEGRIVYWASLQTGRAAVYVNGERVASSWRLAVRSSHTVTIGARPYDIVLRVSVARGTYECALQSGTRTLQGCRMQYVQPGKNAWNWISALAWVPVFAALALDLPGANLYVPLAAAITAGAAVLRSSGGHFVMAPMTV